MATAEEQRRAQLDARYKAKIAARAAGTAPVFQNDPALEEGDNPQAIEARYRAKLARHGRPEPAAAAATAVEAKPEQGEAKRKRAEGVPEADKKPDPGEAKR